MTTDSESQSTTEENPDEDENNLRDTPVIGVFVSFILLISNGIGRTTVKFGKILERMGDNVANMYQDNQRGTLNFYFDMITVGLANLLYKLYPYSDENHTQKLSFDNFTKFKQTLAQIDSEVTVDVYVIRTIAVSSIGAIAGIVFGYLLSTRVVGVLGNVTVEGTQIPVWIQLIIMDNYELFVIPFITLSVALSVGGAIYYMAKQYLSYRVRERNRSIRDIYPQGVKFMYALSVTGANVKDIIYKTADQKQNYGVFSEEMEDIRQMIEKENINLVDAMKLKADEHNEYIEDLLKDLVTVVESGVEPVATLRTKHNASVNKDERYQEETTQKKEFLVQGILMGVVFMILFVMVQFVMSFISDPSTQFLVILANVFVFMMYGMFAVLIKLLDRSVDISDPTIPRLIQRFKHTYTRPLEMVNEHNDIRKRDIHKNSLNKWHHKYARMSMYYYEELKYRLLSPIKIMKERPKTAFAVSIPLALAYAVFVAGVKIIGFEVAGVELPIPTTTGFELFKEGPISVWVVQIAIPLFLALTPPAIAQEIKARRQNEIFGGLDSLMKAIKQSIKTGQTIDASLEAYEATTSDYLREELEKTTNHINWFNDIDEALVMLNNRVNIPEFTRTMTMVIISNRISGDIRESLDVAADDIRRANSLRLSKASSGAQFTALLFVVFLLSTFILLLVLGLFIPIMEQAIPDDGGQQLSFFGGIQIEFFNAVITVLLLNLSFVLGLLSGQLQSQRILAGVKYSIGYTLLLIALLYGLKLVDLTVIVG